MPNLQIGEEFKNLCAGIIAEQRDVNEWSLLESDDMFQSEHFVGGFDTEEAAFCFSYYSSEGTEHWFQITLAQVELIVLGNLTSVDTRPAES